MGLEGEKKPGAVHEQQDDAGADREPDLVLDESVVAALKAEVEDRGEEHCGYRYRQ